METNKIYCGDAIEKMREIPDKSIDMFFTDPPYALGSEIIIRPNGKPDYKKAVDFMDRWEQPDGNFWEAWFIEAFRILKFGGRVIMFGIDRQSWFNAYYAQYAGFQKQMSLYWYFLSSFPKSSDLSKMLDRTAGMEREVVAISRYSANRNSTTLHGAKYKGGYTTKAEGNREITTPASDLAKKYDGYKYSIAPLKQVVEEIAVFQKPYKTGSALHDTLAYENGDTECLCGALDIDGNRVPTNETITNHSRSAESAISKGIYGDSKAQETHQTAGQESGRYPAQSFIDSGAAAILDAQSGVKTSGAMKSTHKVGKKGKDGNLVNYGIYGKMKAESYPNEIEASEGGCSKILMKCDYDEGDFDLFQYCPKVSRDERNAGCEEMLEKEIAINTGNAHNVAPLGRETRYVNFHTTVKPIKLCTAVLKLFKTPNEQVMVDTFCGSGSLIIAAGILGYKWIGIDNSKEYVEIAEARIKHHLGMFK